MSSRSGVESGKRPPTAKQRGGGGGSSSRGAADFELDDGLGSGLVLSPAAASGLSPGGIMPQGMRRIQSSPSIAGPAHGGGRGANSAGASASASRKKASSSSTSSSAGVAASGEVKNVQATKAARRLARKAEAARQSRRRKKAALGNMEETLAQLEARHAQLLKQQQGKNGAVPNPSPAIATGFGTAAHNRSSGSVAALAAANLAKRRDSAQHSSSGPISPLGFPSSAALSRANSDNPPPVIPAVAAPATPPSLAGRFHTVLQQLAVQRSEEVHEKMSFLQQHTTSRGLSVFLVWLLSRSRSWSGEQDQSHRLGQFASVSCMPPFPPPLDEAGGAGSDTNTLWHAVLSRCCGLNSSQLSALLHPRAVSSASSLAEALSSVRQGLDDLARKMEPHCQARAEHNRTLFSLFTPRQKEILAATAFKQQQQQQIHVQQQQQQMPQQQSQMPQQQHSSGALGGGVPPRSQSRSPQQGVSQLPHQMRALQQLPQPQLPQPHVSSSMAQQQPASPAYFGSSPVGGRLSGSASPLSAYSPSASAGGSPLLQPLAYAPAPIGASGPVPTAQLLAHELEYADDHGN